jgi:NhaP-type Na+/H+ or K+/H+ antiporter
LATLLAPTDAALGKAAVSDPSIPGSIRTALNVESGLNDGICVPIFLAFLAMATEAAADQGFAALTLGLLAQEIGIGAAAGLALVAVTVPFMRFCVTRGWFIEAWRHLPVPALAVACFTAAQSLGGSGFIACFTGGLLFNLLDREDKAGWLLPGEAAGDALSLLTWVAFGAVVIGGVIDALTWQVVVYALLSLTVIRMAPVLLALLGSGLSHKQALFIAWFGPRGLATIVFTVMLVDAEIPGADTMALTATCTIILSVVAHGLTAKPLIRALEGGPEQTRGT